MLILPIYLYDEQTHHPETRKPAFRWTGMKSQTNSQTVTTSDLLPKESKKRVFGTELTNICFKRNKLASPVDVAADHDVKPFVKCISESCNSDQGSDRFGQSSLVNMPKSCDGESNTVKKTHDWESLASAYRPQYRNQGIFQALLIVDQRCISIIW